MLKEGSTLASPQAGERAAAAALAPSHPLAHLERMVVRPGLQGRGLGGRYLGEALAEAASRGWAVSLGTQLAENVAFYRRLGFAVASHQREYFSAGGKRAENWFMVRAPAGGAAGHQREGVGAAGKVVGGAQGGGRPWAWCVALVAGVALIWAPVQKLRR